MGSKSMKCTASAPTPVPATATPAARPSDCGGIRDDAKRTHRDACRQNAYRSLFHGTFPKVLKPLVWRRVRQPRG